MNDGIYLTIDKADEPFWIGAGAHWAGRVANDHGDHVAVICRSVIKSARIDFDGRPLPKVEPDRPIWFVRVAPESDNGACGFDVDGDEDLDEAIDQARAVLRERAPGDDVSEHRSTGPGSVVAWVVSQPWASVLPLVGGFVDVEVDPTKTAEDAEQSGVAVVNDTVRWVGRIATNERDCTVFVMRSRLPDPFKWATVIYQDDELYVLFNKGGGSVDDAAAAARESMRTAVPDPDAEFVEFRNPGTPGAVVEWVASQPWAHVRSLGADA